MTEPTEDVDVKRLVERLREPVVVFIDSIPSALRAINIERLEAASTISKLERERDRFKWACSKINDEICQVLGRALGYPRYCDDQEVFLGATDADGVCVGEHVAESIADEAAKRITAAEQSNTTLLSALGKAREALGPFGKFVFIPQDPAPRDYTTAFLGAPGIHDNVITYGDFRRAQSTLADIDATLAPSDDAP